MIKRIVVEIIDSPQEDKNIKFLVGLAKLIGKNEITFTESQILKRDISKNEELMLINQRNNRKIQKHSTTNSEFQRRENKK